MNDYKKLLEGVKEGSISIEDALLEIKKKPFEDIGFAKIDHHRSLRQGAGEVIYGAGKTP
ncbi:MAG: 1-(5-phosphoribosyl)-5-amino-4-imidazole-carboxylate carboxylase, partial [Spirochaetota bacterium]|nr:1-(5-phosphoribosyl)-5-amino-4-imidazole-carboxylate carboxylase [Spirochaetota bacterium]